MAISHNAELFAQFRAAVERFPRNGAKSYQTNMSMTDSVANNFTLEQVKSILLQGDPQQIRNLSRYYYRYNGIYARHLNYMATLLNYDHVLNPQYNILTPPDKKAILKQYNLALEWVEKLNLKILMPRIVLNILRNGVFYGVIRESEITKNVTLQELPVEYCRTRFQTSNGLDVLEFNLNYFDTITDEDDRESALRTFPKEVVLAQRARKKGNSSSSKRKKNSSFWVEIPPISGGLVLYFNDFVPLFVSALSDIVQLDNAVEREVARDQNELSKILIQKLPLDKNSELVFDLTESQEIHKATVDMLRQNPTIDVITTFADVALESVQDSTAASQSNSRIEKYKTEAYDKLGSSSQLFNAENSSAVPYSVRKDIALMHSWVGIVATVIEYQINLRFAKKFSFEFRFLPTNEFFRKENVATYLNAAQYGYSKIEAGVALGISQSSFNSVMHFENEILDIGQYMKPLQSSYTTSGSEEKKSKKENKEENLKTNDITNEGGRPQKDQDEKAPDTLRVEDQPS